ncbi:MAG: hypothetical protein K2L12_02280 [Clostridia bacterium]|nr:hypothetical protein [Clostridia bacterium]
MDIELLDYLIARAKNILDYEKRPQTDEQYRLRKMVLLKSLKKAQSDYALTSDKKYLSKKKQIRSSLFTNVSQTQYEYSKRFLEEYKAAYSNIIDEELWNYKALSKIRFELLCGAKNIEQAVEIYKLNLKCEEALKRFLYNDNFEGLTDEENEALKKYFKLTNK